MTKSEVKVEKTLVSKELKRENEKNPRFKQVPSFDWSQNPKHTDKLRE